MCLAAAHIGFDVDMVENPIRRISNAVSVLKSSLYSRADLSRDFSRYFIVACLNSVFMFSVYQFIYWLDPLNMYTGEIAWFLSFIIGTIEAHYVHRRLTFQSNADYGESLFWMFVFYTVIGILSTLTISALIRTYEVQYQLAWVINNCIFGLVYFVGLRLLAFPPEVGSEG